MRSCILPSSNFRVLCILLECGPTLGYTGIHWDTLGYTGTVETPWIFHVLGYLNLHTRYERNSNGNLYAIGGSIPIGFYWAHLVNVRCKGELKFNYDDLLIDNDKENYIAIWRQDSSEIKRQPCVVGVPEHDKYSVNTIGYYIFEERDISMAAMNRMWKTMLNISFQADSNRIPTATPRCSESRTKMRHVGMLYDMEAENKRWRNTNAVQSGQTLNLNFQTSHSNWISKGFLLFHEHDGTVTMKTWCMRSK